jgi:hypothetical protein
MYRNIAIALLSAFLGYSAAKFNQPPPPPAKPCPVCELNVTGRIQEIPDANLFAKNKRKVSIYFNGLDGISGILDANNNGNFVGQYKNKPASAVCSGADSVTCTVNFDGKAVNLTFGKE